MVLFDLYHYQEIATEPTVVIERFIREDQAEKTNLPEIPSEEEEKQFTSRLENKEKEIVASSPENIEAYLGISSFSSAYVSYNTKVLVGQLVEELSSWERVGTEEGLIYISNIKDLLEGQQQYCYQRSENRILISLLQLMFENNSWESLTAGQIRQLRDGLARFREGKVDWEGLEKLSKQMYRGKITLFRSGVGNGQKEKR